MQYAIYGYPYFDQILGKRESQTRQVFNFVGILLRDFAVLKLLAGTKFHEAGQKSRKSLNLILTKFNETKLVPAFFLPIKTYEQK